MTMYVWKGGAGTWLDPASWTPGGFPLWGDANSAVITAGSAVLADTQPNGITIYLGASVLAPLPAIVLDNAAFGPSLTLSIAPPPSTGAQHAMLDVNGWDTNYGTIDVMPSPGGRTSGNGNFLDVEIPTASQLNQDGTVRVISPETITTEGSGLAFIGGGTLDNNGEIYVGRGSFLTAPATTGAGTITVDHATADLFNVAASQHVDFRGGTITISPATFDATIKDWNSQGEVVLFGSYVNAVSFTQTSAQGGDLALLNGSNRIGSLHLLGTYATGDFHVVHGHTAVAITLGGQFPPPG